MRSVCHNPSSLRVQLRRPDRRQLHAPTSRATTTSRERGSKNASLILRASTTWLLDGVGCSGARSGDEALVGFSTRSSNLPVACPPRPINVSLECESRGDAKFEMLDVIFELSNDQLFVYSADYVRPALTDTGASISGATEHEHGEDRTQPGVRFFLFAVAAQEAWSVLTSQIATVTGKVERDMLGEYDCSGDLGCALDEAPVDGSSLTVDGVPIPAFDHKTLLRPGTVLRLHGHSFEVNRDVHAHA